MEEVGELPFQAPVVVICVQILKLIFGGRFVITVSFLRWLTLVMMMMMMFLPPPIHVCQLAMSMSMSMSRALANYVQLDNIIVLQ